jgi:hypothetical protein
LKSLPEGTPRLARSRIVLGRVFIDTIPLQQILRDVHVDAIVADSAFLGVLPMPLGACAWRPAVILCGTSVLHWERVRHKCRLWQRQPGHEF